MSNVPFPRPPISHVDEDMDMSQFQKKKLDVYYTSSKKDSQSLDVIYPTVGSAPYKFVLIVHGGAFIVGSKRMVGVKTMIEAPLELGYAVVSINYRMADEAKYPACNIDAKSAIRYIRAHAKELELDVSKFVVWGESAGGYVVQMLGLYGDEKYNEGEYMDQTSKVDAVISWYGICDLLDLTEVLVGSPQSYFMGFDIKGSPENEEKAKKASPLYNVTKTCSPILLIHGDSDCLVPCRQSEKFHKKICEVCGPDRSQLVVLKGANHADKNFRDVKRIIENDMVFLDKIWYPGGKNPFRK